MKLLAPSEISSRITSLLFEAQKSVTVISPFVSAKDWIALEKLLQLCIQRGCKIDFYIKKDATQDTSVFEGPDINLFEIENLNVAIYVNEKHALVTTHGVSASVGEESIDIGYITETQQERQDVARFIDRCVKKAILAKKVSFPLVTGFDYCEDITLTKIQLSLLRRAFVCRYGNAEFSMEDISGRIFSQTLLPFAAICIHTRYEIKIPKKQFNFSEVASQIINLRYPLSNSFYGVQSNSNRSFYQIHFIPFEIKDMHSLQHDYFQITDQLRKILNVTT